MNQENILLRKGFKAPKCLKYESLNPGLYLQEIHVYRPKKHWPSMILTLSDPHGYE